MEIWGRAPTEFREVYLFEIDGMAAMKGEILTHLNSPDFDRFNSTSYVGDGRNPFRTGAMEQFTAIKSACVLNDAQIRQLVSAWNGIRGDEQMRCHVPHHVFATFDGTCFDWAAAICVSCDNVSISGSAATEGWRLLCQMPDTKQGTNTEFITLMSGFLGKPIVTGVITIDGTVA